MSFSLLRHAKANLNVTEAELAQAIGKSRSYVGAVIQGRFNEWLDGKQRRDLLEYCRLVRDRAVQAVDEMELMF